MNGYHDLVHRIALWLGHDFGAHLPAGFHAVVDVVLLWAPLAMALLVATRLWRRLARGRPPAPALRPTPRAPLPPSAAAFALRHSRRAQIGLTALGLLSMPILYAALELPKIIINGAIDSHHFPVDIAGVPMDQVEYLLALCALFLLAILASGAVKYAVNVAKGRVGERLLRRLRLKLLGAWRKGAGPSRRTEIIPLLGQEVEPVGGFCADLFATPALQGGTFVTIIAFMIAQDPILGAAALTLLPIQLALVPRLQRRVNRLARLRVAEMRRLGGVLGDQATASAVGDLRTAACGLRRIEAIRRDIHRAKYLAKSVNNLLTALTPFFFYAIGGYLVIEERLSLGALVAVLAAHKDMSMPLRELFRFYQTSEDVKVRYAALISFLDQEVDPAALSRRTAAVATVQVPQLARRLSA